MKMKFPAGAQAIGIGGIPRRAPEDETAFATAIGTHTNRSTKALFSISAGVGCA